MEAESKVEEQQVDKPEMSEGLSSVVGEIESAISETVDQIERDKQGRFASSDKDKSGKEEFPAEDDESADEEQRELATPAEKVEGESSAITDEQIERAVKAGMSISDAKAFGTPDRLDRFCSMLEAKSVKSESAGESQKDLGEDDGLNVLDSIPDLNPEDYDEKIVEGFKAMKEIIGRQSKVIGELKSVGADGKGSWLDSQVASLGKAFAQEIGEGPKSMLDPNSPQFAKRKQIEDKFSVLKAGYDAAKIDAGNDQVFKEAVSLVLGDVESKAAESDKAATLAKRATQHIQRPGGQINRAESDPFDDAADKLDRKFFKT